VFDDKIFSSSKRRDRDSKEEEKNGLYAISKGKKFKD